MRSYRPLASAVVTVLVAASGCNAILGNDHGVAFDDDGGADAAIEAMVSVDVFVPSDVSTKPPVDATPDVAGPCGAGEKWCFGQCVTLSSPQYGCAVEACDACKLTRASATCAGGRCAIAACEQGYADCDPRTSNGCETDLSQATHCGACNAVCPSSAPFCAPTATAGTFACSTNCPAQAPTLCGTQCVDLETSASHCGDCNTPCPAVVNGVETCVARACRLACNAGFHACGGACASNADPATCGSSCTPCAAPANATATCSAAGACGWTCKPGFHACGAACVSNDDVATCGSLCTPCPSQNATPSCSGGACGFTCAAGWGDCDRNPANACETNTQTSPTDCGSCGRSCGANPCVGGQCQVPDAGPADAGPSDAAPSDAEAG